MVKKRRKKSIDMVLTRPYTSAAQSREPSGSSCVEIVAFLFLQLLPRTHRRNFPMESEKLYRNETIQAVAVILDVWNCRSFCTTTYQTYKRVDSPEICKCHEFYQQSQRSFFQVSSRSETKPLGESLNISLEARNGTLNSVNKCKLPFSGCQLGYVRIN